jgi:NAD-dependent deacetylase
VPERWFRLVGPCPTTVGLSVCSRWFSVRASLSNVQDDKGEDKGELDSQVDEDLVREVRGWIDQAERVVVLTGAGISTESGIPDFRGPQGVWTKNPAAERASNLQTYMSDPEVRRQAWRTRLDHAARRSVPNQGHRALVTLEQRGKLDTLVTQNIDRLHHDAGSDPERIVEVHGNMREVVCMACDERAPMERALDRVRAGEDDPPCRSCGGILKSATISFGQNLVVDDLRRAEAAARRCDLLLAVGSTLSVYPIADVVPLALASGARVVVVNGSPTAMDHIADAVLRGSIGTILPALVG